MFCEHCGKEIKDNAIFCKYCGVSVTEKTDVNQPQTADIISPYIQKDTVVSRKKKKYGTPDARLVIILIMLVIGCIFLYFYHVKEDKATVKRSFDAGERFYDDKEYENAIAEYKTVLEIDPNNRDAIEAIERAYTKWIESEMGGDIENARNICEDAVEYFERKVDEITDADTADSYEAAASRYQDVYEEIIELLSKKNEGIEEVTSVSLVLTIVRGNSDQEEGRGIGGANVSIKSCDGDYQDEQTADEKGRVTFILPKAGDYTITASADGYITRTMDTDFYGDYISMIYPIVKPIVSEDDACVLIVWRGEQDLDFCGYNSAAREYVNISHPMDSQEKFALFADNSAADKFEYVYIHDVSDSIEKDIYVMDTAAAQQNMKSLMEMDGVEIYVYNYDGLEYHIKANRGHDASVWFPCYYYEGEVHEVDEYISNTSELAWVSLNIDDQFDGQGTHTGTGNVSAHIELTDDDMRKMQGLSWVFLGTTNKISRENMNDLDPQDYLLYICEFSGLNILSRDYVDRNPNAQGEEIDICAYDATAVEQYLRELFGCNIELRDRLPGSLDEINPYGPGAYYENGIVYVCYTSGVEDADTTELIQQKTVNSKLILAYSCYNEYDRAANSNNYNIQGYVIITLEYANNSLGYEVCSAEFQNILPW